MNDIYKNIEEYIIKKRKIIVFDMIVNMLSKKNLINS